MNGIAVHASRERGVEVKMLFKKVKYALDVHSFFQKKVLPSSNWFCALLWIGWHTNLCAYVVATFYVA